jgi:hypothetical protein
MKLLGAGYTACEKCGGGMPHDVDDDLVCRCGTVWVNQYAVEQYLADWDAIGLALTTRSGNRCEIRSPWCLGGKHGDLSKLPRHRVSFHHRRPRGMGGTRRADVHSLSALVLTCGDGTQGCHGYAESYREWARDERGLLVPNIGTGDAIDPAVVPLVLASGRRVLLPPDLPRYLPAPGLAYAV